MSGLVARVDCVVCGDIAGRCRVAGCYAYELLLTHTKSTYRLITILAVYENGPGLSQDNPLCLPFYFTLFSVRFSEVLDSCTVQRHQMVDGSASEAL